MSKRQAKDRLAALKKKTSQSIYSQAAEVTRLVEVAFPTLTNADRRAMALEYFTRAWESKSMQRHLLSVTATTLKDAVQAIEEYLAVTGLKTTPRAMPVEQTELPSQPSALEISLKAMAEAVTQQTMLLQRVLEKVEQRPAKKSCFKCGGPHMQRDCPSEWQTAVSQHTNGGGKRGRCSTGVSSPVTGSQVSEQAVAQEPAVSVGQDDWTVVKRRRRGRKQAEKQSEMLAGDSRAKAEPRAPPQQT